MASTRKMILTRAITTMLWPYTLKDFLEQLNELNVYDDRITHMYKFSGNKA